MGKESANKSTDPQPCCCSSGSEAPPAITADREKAAWISGSVTTPIGEMPRVRTTLDFVDTWGSFKARCSIGRMKFRVPPGLYAVGEPTAKSPVFVSANYKLSFDWLRSSLAEIDSWIMVLDTKGINVWCAAGKGTFGTEELISRIDSCRLREVVDHQRLILPQLGAPGIAAHQVKDRTGFRVVYGPILATDIPAFLDAGFKATPEMRRVRFRFRDRAILVPNDVVQGAKYPLIAAACFLVLSGFGPGIYAIERVVNYGLISAALVLVAYLAGSVLPPMLLPWLPGRAFATKGAWLGLGCAAVIGWSMAGNTQVFRNTFALAAWFLLFPAVTSFIAMNFTGSSTYTSLSGVLKEMRLAVPAQIVTAAGGVGLWLTGLFV